LPHGYTNSTRRMSPGRIAKRYRGPGRHERCRRELLCVSALAAWLPVPSVLEHHPDDPSLVMTELPGRPGQDLIDEGHADTVMALVGDVMRTVHSVPRTAVAELDGRGPVLVHGDFGPHNMLFDFAAEQPVVGLVDWEFAHHGDAVEDLAWAEWTLRMHHPAHVTAVGLLLEHAGSPAPWSERHAAMVRRCGEVLTLVTAQGSPDGVALWRRRLADTEGWRES
jgi:tRNA A-37 threonylcarbamoyl transferase component Bud32